MEAEWMNGFSTALVLPDREFINLTRSTIPLVCYWRDRSRALASLAKALDLPDLATVFEAETASVGPGRGISYRCNGSFSHRIRGYRGQVD